MSSEDTAGEHRYRTTCRDPDNRSSPPATGRNGKFLPGTTVLGQCGISQVHANGYRTIPMIADRTSNHHVRTEALDQLLAIRRALRSVTASRKTIG
ncbi:hypothetical protein RHA1_ro11042 (plasmid) [Rhodococcus jostii RHA1]|uniref:Uncharacterized protein n=1 Tax=Rhodococcus jostii (strain RHA1) TaxID=101510 RepID=Q0RVJ7_RHOJR|nr:hypothetical protein RHA1_ro11042 [Rhodococcus jostii RHA1]